MPDTDKITGRINAVAKLIGAIAALAGLFLGIPKVEELMSEGQEQMERASEKEIEIEPISKPIESESSVTNNNVSLNSDFELIREGFLLKETRFITFDNEKYRLSFREINSSSKTAIAVIGNNKGTEITRDTIAEGDQFKFIIDSITYKVSLYGIKNRFAGSNLALFDIYKSQ